LEVAFGLVFKLSAGAAVVLDGDNGALASCFGPDVEAERDKVGLFELVMVGVEVWLEAWFRPSP
jgi:hypothetical protein